MNFDLFCTYFKENMSAMGFSTSSELYGSMALAFKSGKELIEIVEKFGTKVTVRELVIAGKLSEKHQVVSAVAVAAYAGIVIGSILVAIQRCLCKGQTLADLLADAVTYQLDSPFLLDLWIRYPGIYDKTHPGRASYGVQLGHYA